MRNQKVSAEPIKRGRGNPIPPPEQQKAQAAQGPNAAQPSRIGQRFSSEPSGQQALQKMFEQQIRQQRKGG